MSIQDQINRMLQGGVAQIVIGLAPDKRVFVQVEQFIATGSDGNTLLAKHQRVGANVGECFGFIADDLAHCAKLQSKLLRVVEEQPQTETKN